MAPSWKSTTTTNVLLLISTVLPLTSLANPLPQTAKSSQSSSSSSVEAVGEPVLIDPLGVYIRATTLNLPTSDTTSTSSRVGILAAYAALVDNSQKIIRISQSLDNATSWAHTGEVTRADDATTDLDNAMPLQLPSGRLLVAYRNHDRIPGPEGKAGDNYTYYRITMSYSDDYGRTWKFLSHVVEREANRTPGKKNGLWEPFLRMARDGSTVQCYYSSENDDEDQDNLMVVSRDGGLTWSSDRPVMVSGGELSKTRDGMTGVAEVDGRGTLICVFESVTNGIFSIHRVLSHNDGQTWTDRSPLYTAADGKDAGAPQVCNVGVGGGTLVTSFMTNEDLDPSLPHLDGGQMKVVTSDNGALDWSSMSRDGIVTAGVGSHWPGLSTLPGDNSDGKFLALYSTAGIGAVSRVFRVV